MWINDFEGSSQFCKLTNQNHIYKPEVCNQKRLSHRQDIMKEDSFQGPDVSFRASWCGGLISDPRKNFMARGENGIWGGLNELITRMIGIFYKISILPNFGKVDPTKKKRSPW